MPKTKKECEYVFSEARNKFSLLQNRWEELLLWTTPHRARGLNRNIKGDLLKGKLITDTTHLDALSSFVAGFLEGNTSQSRPWYFLKTSYDHIDLSPETKAWLHRLTSKTVHIFSKSNYYNAASPAYSDIGTVGTCCHLIDEVSPERLHFHTLLPGTYFPINNSRGEPVILCREYSLTVKALVETFAERVDGKFNWSNISIHTRQLYENSDFAKDIAVRNIIMSNDDFNPNEPLIGDNRPWVSYYYEGPTESYGNSLDDDRGRDITADKFLRRSYYSRKPFVVGRIGDDEGFEYGLKSPTIDAIECIRSLNKKAISKDVALDKILSPTLQGPASIRKSYMTQTPNALIPLPDNLDPRFGLRPIYDLNPQITTLASDVDDIRRQVSRLYYADFLMHLSLNPKTRTATEAQGVMDEQRLILGPILQSLNTTYNQPLVDYVVDFVLENDLDFREVPEELLDKDLEPEFISLFAQAQKSADLPSIERLIQLVQILGESRPDAWDKLDVDQAIEIFGDRLYVDPRLLVPEQKVQQVRQDREEQFARQQQFEQQLALANVAKDVQGSPEGQGGLGGEQPI